MPTKKPVSIRMSSSDIRWLHRHGRGTTEQWRIDMLTLQSLERLGRSDSVLTVREALDVLSTPGQ
jgi:hypothetical protein